MDVNGVYKPTYNWGGHHLVPEGNIFHPIRFWILHLGERNVLQQWQVQISSDVRGRVVLLNRWTTPIMKPNKINLWIHTYTIIYPMCFMCGIFAYKTGWFWTRANVGKYSSTMEQMGTRDSHVYHMRLLNCKSISICCNKSNNSWRICVPKVEMRYSSSNKRQVHSRENVAWYPSQFLVSRTAATLEKNRHALSCDIELNHVIYGYRKKKVTGHCVTIETIHITYICAFV